MLHCPVGEAEDVAGLADRREAMSIETLPALRPTRAPWNKERIIGQKRPLLPKHVWSIRARLEMADNKRDLALFNMAVDSKLRGCDLVYLKVNDVYAAGPCKGTSFGHSEQDAQASALRDHLDHAHLGGAMDQRS